MTGRQPATVHAGPAVAGSDGGASSARRHGCRCRCRCRCRCWCRCWCRCRCCAEAGSRDRMVRRNPTAIDADPADDGGGADAAAAGRAGSGCRCWCWCRCRCRCCTETGSRHRMVRRNPTAVDADPADDRGVADAAAARRLRYDVEDWRDQASGLREHRRSRRPEERQSKADGDQTARGTAEQGNVQHENWTGFRSRGSRSIVAQTRRSCP